MLSLEASESVYTFTDKKNEDKQLVQYLWKCQMHVGPTINQSGLAPIGIDHQEGMPIIDTAISQMTCHGLNYVFVSLADVPVSLARFLISANLATILSSSRKTESFPFHLMEVFQICKLD